ncbi:MAG: flippase [Bacteroidota bacterium]
MKTLLKNFLPLLSGEVVSKVLGFLATLYLARRLGSESFGKLGFALALYSYVALLVANGTETVAIREVARGNSAVPLITSTVFLLRWLFVAAAGLVLAIVVATQSLDGPTLILLLLQSANLLLFPWSLQYVAQGLQKTPHIALTRGIQSILYLAFVLATVQSFDDVNKVPILLFASTLIAQLVLLAIYRNRFGRLFKMVPWSEVMSFLRSSIPLGLASVFVAISTNADTVILGFTRTANEVGFYSAAYKIILFVAGFQVLFSQATLAFFSNLKQKNPGRLKSLVGNMLPALFEGSLVLALFLFFFAQQICGILFGQLYGESAAALRVLSFVIPLLFSESVAIQLLLAADRQKTYMTVTGIGGLLNIAANILVIPLYGIVGAAFVTLVSESLVLTLLLWSSRSILGDTWSKFSVEYLGAAVIVFLLFSAPQPGLVLVFAIVFGMLFVMRVRALYSTEIR